MVDVELRAVSVNSQNQPMGAITALISWDPTRLRLVGVLQNSTYQWFANFFPDDRGIDRLNCDKSPTEFWSEIECTNNNQCAPIFGCSPAASCTIDGGCRPEDMCDLEQTCGTGGCCDARYCGFTFLPFNDGNARYEAWANFPDDPAYATPGPNGLLVDTFRFEVIDTGSSQVSFIPTFGFFSETVVYSGVTPNQCITNSIGTPVSVTTGSGSPPTASIAGPRYIAITPAASQGTVALKVQGVSASVTCVDKYVQVNGTLGTTAVFRTPAQWGTVYAHDCEIIPGTTYNVRADCGSGLSNPVPVTMWGYGDSNNVGGVDLDDIVNVLDGFAGIFTPPITIRAVDMLGCVPDTQIDLDDIVAVLDAFAGIPYTSTCPNPCPITAACP